MTTREEVIQGGRALDDLLRTLAPKIHKNINRSALRSGAVVMLDEVKNRIPVDSGQLRASARVTTRAAGGMISASVKVGNFVAWYANLVEFGTRPHEIKAKPGQALRIGGAAVQRVDHPGAQAQPFMRPAADAALTAAIDAYTDKLRQRLTNQGINVPAPGSGP